MDAFREDLSPEEIKMATIAFMGQHLTGDLKMLQSNMVSQNSTCLGNSLNPLQVINTIPTTQQPNPVHTTVNAGINIPRPQPQQNYVQVTEHRNNIQEKSSDNLILKEIANTLKRIEEKLDKIKIS